MSDEYEVYNMKTTDLLESLHSKLLNNIENITEEEMTIFLEAKKKQIPKKIKIEQYIYTECSCGYEFSKHHGDGYYSVPYENRTNYCPNCGQKLDWS